jgi:hypothetical protein
MRVIAWTCLALVASLGVAHAGRTTVVVMADADRAAALDSALQVTLAGRDVVIASSAAPEGALRLARAAAAQHTAVSLGAEAALWVDREAGSIEVCAVSPDGGYFRHAPIASESPRAFAEIAASLLDELFAPPEGVNVHVDVHIDGALASATALPMAAVLPLAPPPPALALPTAIASAARNPRPRAGHTLLEIGPTVALVENSLAAGIEAEIAFPVGSWLRLGLGGHVLEPLFADAAATDTGPSYIGPMYDVFAELRATSAGRRHADVGLIGGLMPSGASDANLLEIGARLSYAWDGAWSGVSVSLVPCLLHSFLVDQNRDAVFVTLGWELPL